MSPFHAVVPDPANRVARPDPDDTRLSVFPVIVVPLASVSRVPVPPDCGPPSTVRLVELPRAVLLPRTRLFSKVPPATPTTTGPENMLVPLRLTVLNTVVVPPCTVRPMAPPVEPSPITPLRVTLPAVVLATVIVCTPLAALDV